MDVLLIWEKKLSYKNILRSFQYIKTDDLNKFTEQLRIFIRSKLISDIYDWRGFAIIDSETSELTRYLSDSSFDGLIIDAVEIKKVIKVTLVSRNYTEKR